MNNCRYITAFAVLLCLCSGLFGQGAEATEKAPFVHSVEGELQMGFGGGRLGGMAKGNHDLWTRKKWTIRMGASLSFFYLNESSSDLVSETSGGSFDTHFRLHGDAVWAFPRSERAFLSLGMYAGGFHVFTKGRYQNTALDIDASYQNSEWYWDAGTRLAAGYRLPSDWGFQLSMTNSWRQAGFGLGLAVALLGAQPDGKTSLGIGVTRWF